MTVDVERPAAPAAGHQHFKTGPNRLQGLLWVAFANAAVLAALVIPAQILVMGVLGPMGLVPAFDRRYGSFASAIGDPLVKVYLLVVVAASFYLAAHRVRYVLKELQVPGKLVVGLVLYGLAGIGILIAADVLFTLP